jgi:hypothetical protein
MKMETQLIAISFLTVISILSTLGSASADLPTFNVYSCSLAQNLNNDFQLRHLSFTLRQTETTSSGFTYVSGSLDVGAYPVTEASSSINTIESNTVVDPIDGGVAISGHDPANGKTVTIFVANIVNNVNVVSGEVDIANPVNPNRPQEAHLSCVVAIEQQQS